MPMPKTQRAVEKFFRDLNDLANATARMLDEEGGADVLAELMNGKRGRRANRRRQRDWNGKVSEWFGGLAKSGWGPVIFTAIMVSAILLFNAIR